MSDAKKASWGSWAWLALGVVLCVLGGAAFWMIRSAAYVATSKQVLVPGQTIMSKQSALFHGALYLYIACAGAALLALLRSTRLAFQQRKYPALLTSGIATIACVMISLFGLPILDIASSNQWLTEQYLVTQRPSPSGKMTAYAYTSAKGSCTLYIAKTNEATFSSKHHIGTGFCHKGHTKIHWSNQAETKLQLTSGNMPAQLIDLQVSKTTPSQPRRK